MIFCLNVGRCFVSKMFQRFFSAKTMGKEPLYLGKFRDLRFKIRKNE